MKVVARIGRARRRGTVGCVTVAMGLMLAATFASPALAERTYDSQITGFSNPWAVTVDSADNVWISDPGNEGLISEYGPYPSQTKIGEQTGGGRYGAMYIRSLAVNSTNNSLYVADSGPVAVDIFDNTGAFVEKFTHGFGGGFLYVAADSASPSSGRFYVAATSPDSVQAFETDRTPHEFSATASYISGNSITGTPSGAFGEPSNVATDAEGNIYLVDRSKEVVDEFQPSGEFVQAFTGSDVPGGFSGNLTGVAVDPTNGNVLVVDGGSNMVDEFESSGAFLDQISGSETPTGSFSQLNGGIAVNSEGYVYLADGGNGVVDLFSPNAPLPRITYETVSNATQTSGTFNAKIDPNGAGEDAGCYFEYGTDASYGSPHIPCSPATPYSSPTQVSANISGLTAETTYHYRVVVTDVGGDTKKGSDQTFTPRAVSSLSTDPATNPAPTSATLNGSFVGNGEDTHYHFQWGTTTTYGHETSVEEAGSPAGPGRTPISTGLTGLEPVTTYHFRAVAENGFGTSFGGDQTFTTRPLAPLLSALAVGEVRADTALIHASINPGGGDTTYYVEYVGDQQFEEHGFENAAQSPSFDAGSARTAQPVTVALSGLSAGTVYHYRFVAANATSSTELERTFTTLPFIPPINDPCPNAHVRQQTGAAQLLDCRGYELVSAADTGGYDVESSLIPGQTPFGGYPEADGRVLYGVHNGGIPGTGSPTNRGVDPYVATRGEAGWSTKYVGIPADGTPSAAPFSSTLIGTDSALESFAFGGPEICSPCFENGDTGEPIRLPSGSLVQGMAGSEEPGPSAKASEVVAKPLSADGSHFVFASTSRFEPDGNDNGDVSIYDRNLNTGSTHVVSKTPGEATMTGAGISELDISRDGSHVLIGRLVSEAEGDAHYHLYMNVGDSAKTVDLTPGTTSGVLYDGMSADGTEVFFTTKDQLLSEDEDESADLYVASISGQSATLGLLSRGSEGTGNTDLCNPSANSVRQHWNTKGAVADCGIVAIGGGGGVASQEGSVYFLSPERLDGSSKGTQNAPNLYLAHAGEAPHYVTTLESALNLPHPPKQKRSFDHSFGSFDTAAGLAVDHSDGSVYVINAPTEAQAEGGAKAYIEKFDSSGNLVASFGDTTPAHDGRLVGSETPAGSFAPNTNFPPGQLAVDNDPGSPSYRDLYVPDFGNGVVDKFGPEGQYKGQVEASLANGVTVDSATGNLYVSQIYNIAHGSAYVSVFTPEGVEVPSAGFGVVALAPDAIAVDPTTKFVYLDQGGGEEAEVELYTPAGLALGAFDPHPAHSLSVDPATSDLYADEGSKISRFDSSGQRLETVGSGTLNGSEGVAIDPEGNLYASNGADVAAFTPSLAPDPRIDNPAVVDSVSEPSTRRTADFQVTPDGSYAAFDSTLALGGGEEDTAGHSEVYRYQSGDAKLTCVSCTTTGAPSAGDSSLASNGLSLLNDGRLFFNSTDQLVSADTDGKQDVYEFAQPGAGNCDSESTAYDKATGDCLALISAGTSPSDSGLLSASSNGKDAFFFTRDPLAPQDKSGSTIKIYDAREEGGFPYVNPEVQCQASDECHGAASAAPGPVEVGSVAGTPGNAPVALKCKKGMVKKRGTCVKSHHHKKHHHRRPNSKRGGAK